MDKIKLIEAILSSECGESSSASSPALPWRVGQKLIMRGVTYHSVGRIKQIVGSFVELEDASWVACSKRYMDTLMTGELEEVEPYKCRCWVNAEACNDVQEWNHPLPTEQK